MNISPSSSRIVVTKAGGQTSSVEIEEVDWIRAADNYVELHVAKAVHLIRRTLTSLERELRLADFLRLGRSLMVNANRIKDVHSTESRDLVVVLMDGTRLPVTDAYRDQVESRFGTRG